MIAKVKLTNNPGVLINYILGDKQGPGNMMDRAVILDRNYCHGDSIDEMKEQFQMILSNCRLKSPAMHIMLSLAPGEQLSETQKFDLVYTVREKMKMQDFPYVAVEHLDTDSHWHLHIAVGRKSPITGKTLSDSNSYQKLMEVCRRVEKDFGLRAVQNPWDHHVQRSDSRKIKMRLDIIEAIKQSNNLNQFLQVMERSGYRVEKGRGIAFVDEKGMRAKGSDPQIGFSLGKLIQIFKEPTPSLFEERADSAPEKQSQPNSEPKFEGDSWLSLFDTDGFKTSPAMNADQSGPRLSLDDEDEWLKRKRRKTRRP